MEIGEAVEDPPAAFEKAGGFVRMEGPQLVEPGFTDPEDPSGSLRIDRILTVRVLQTPSDIQGAMVNEHASPRLSFLSPPRLR